MLSINLRQVNNKMSEVNTYQLWTMSDELWAELKDEIPLRQRDKNKVYRNQPGQGRKPLSKRKVLEGIFYIFKTHCHWKELPQEYGASSSIHRYFHEWKQAGFFEKVWTKSLEQYDEMEGIAWEWQNVDGCMVKVRLDRETAEHRPTAHRKTPQKKTVS